MGFYKHAFPIRMIDAAPNTVEIVTGWRLEGTYIGFHKVRNGKAWAATDLYSGMRICTCETRKACVEWCEQNRQRINNRMNEPEYVWRVTQFRILLEEELKKL